jgi:ParB-like chromosome segregation protein Spo0J
VRELKDEEVLAIQLIENLQRESSMVLPKRRPG